MISAESTLEGEFDPEEKFSVQDPENLTTVPVPSETSILLGFALQKEDPGDRAFLRFKHWPLNEGDSLEIEETRHPGRTQLFQTLSEAVEAHGQIKESIKQKFRFQICAILHDKRIMPVSVCPLTGQARLGNPEEST